MSWVKNLDKAVCISIHANTLGKDINPNVPFPAMNIRVEQTKLFRIGWAITIQETCGAQDELC